ncbi:hypothetical protein [Sinanaerobacter chloroacetimidivorans]|uniref:Uncharacterized protein n=1 Tax=Sinanaerobacter chloroacetimidivorans TaxID=2818044 RepID=A0A8J8B2S5_9FIRM|nr:hypothetical protein [Sinanaerobacter chloroacetimidivorans]MBR0599036.1 hypothetical protein [Sinanaerobacter chloroacetimidivorans]
MKKYNITLKNGRKYECVADKDLNLNSFNNFANFIELEGVDGIKMIFAKDEIETVRVEELEDRIESEEDPINSYFKDKFNITDEQLKKLYDGIAYSRKWQPVWDHKAGYLRFE